MFYDPNILEIRSDFLRKTLANFIVKMRLNSAKQNYEKLGGKSPINDITKSLCNKICKFAKDEFVADFVMNYTPPFADEVVKKYSNFDEIYLLPLYPHYSQTTVKSSILSTIKSLEKFGIKNYKILDIFYENRLYNEIIIDIIKEKISNLRDDEISQISLIFSAHSLPQKMVKKGDPYEKQINLHIQNLKKSLIQNNLHFKEIVLAYQSKLGPIKWLEPNIAEVLANLQNKKALIFPIAFCIDNSETIFELDSFYRDFAKKHKFEFYEVCPCPNDSDKFANFILSLSKAPKVAK